ncbi:MAG: DivIVA domain-containing protein [Acidimicrobiia bacterium]|nr:DivIVA domain-containing protein [Acidimicrobiia bacterium]
MKVDASTVAKHEFTAVRRRGYDPSEVDAVMARVAEALRTFEQRVVALEEALREAQEPSEAIQRILVAAQRTKDEMVAEAQLHAEELRKEAFTTSHELIESCKAEAEMVRTESLSKAHELQTQSQATLTEAEEAADQIVASAEHIAGAIEAETEKMVAASHQEAEELLTDARREAQQRMEMSERAATATLEMAVAEADDVRDQAQTTSQRMLDDTTSETSAMVEEAETHAATVTEQATEAAEETTRSAAAEAAAVLTRSRTEAEDRLSSSQSQAGRILEHARERALEITVDAREEKDALERRLAQLRTAVSEIEAELHGLAELALERVVVAESMFALERLEPRAAVGMVSGTAVVTAGNVASWTPAGFPSIAVEDPPPVSEVVELVSDDSDEEPSEDDEATVADHVADVIEMVEVTDVDEEFDEPVPSEGSVGHDVAEEPWDAPGTAGNEPEPSGFAGWGVDDLRAAEAFAASAGLGTPIPDGSGLLPEQRTEPESLTIDLTGDEPVVEVHRDRGTQTIYQRRTGGLRRRLEEALGAVEDTSTSE